MIQALYGAGGFSHDIKSSRELGLIPCFVDNKYFEENAENIYPFSAFNPVDHELIIAVGDPKDRQDMAKRLPENTKFWTYISSTVHMGQGVSFGVGAAILNNTVVVCHSKVGIHCHLNFGVIIGHDTNLGDYFTAAPGVFIGGDCNIGNRVYFGGNACCKQKITICDDVTIGMGAVVVKDITKPGVYVGCPARKVK